MDACFRQARGREQTAEAAAHDDNLNVLGDRITGEVRIGVGIVEVMRVLSRRPDILGGAVRTPSAIPFETILLAQRRRIEAAAFGDGHGRCSLGHRPVLCPSDPVTLRC
jgi:hypothetical protein